MKTTNRTSRKWYKMDLHLHTPASSDYQQDKIENLDILRKAEARGLDIIAFTDHNTVAGYRKLKEEIEQLKLLHSLQRILPEEESKLQEFNRLMEKILVLPGFEFTATFGFHILGIFPPDKPIREIEHLLLKLNVPSQQLDEGSATIGASADVLSAYEGINQLGGIAIAAHANSSNGVAMRGFSFGGQTKIAFTQSPYLHALEVTDLEVKGRRTTASFFNGTKPEYPRRMHCIQGSDAHRLENDPSRKKNLGIGDRASEVLLSDVKFSAMLDLFKSNDFARTRPLRRKSGESDFDFIKAAREEGSNIVQEFYPTFNKRGTNNESIISDVSAFANTNGGTLYLGIDNDPKNKISGVSNPVQAIAIIEEEINNRISPPLSCIVDQHKSSGKSILRILVPRGIEPPYTFDDNNIYVRAEAETSLAVRDEIVGLVLRGIKEMDTPQTAVITKTVKESPPPIPEKEEVSNSVRTGVEVVSKEERKGRTYFELKDLRNGNVVKNVTEKSARKLWHYAITQYLKLPKNLNKAKIDWKNDLGVVRKYKQGKNERFDLAQKIGKTTHFYYGVTVEGVDDQWNTILGIEE